MKILKKIWGISILAVMLVMAAPHISKAQEDGAITEQDFYDALAPYGTWVYDNNYGDVWLPDVDENFKPYQTQGYWVMTEYGNTWVSDYPWGWAAFHYGQWRFDDYYGWEWIPGYEWAPAQVAWREGNGYYGWAPLSPDIDYSMSVGAANFDSYWAFAPVTYIYSPSVYSYYVPRTRVTNVIHRTTIINNTYVRNGHNYAGGPRAADYEKYTHRRPTVYTVTNASRPGGITVGGRSVNIFRPSISRSQNASPQRTIDGKAYQQQNPGQRIARGAGSLTFDRNNAQKLADQARAANPNSGFVRVKGQPNQQPVQAPTHGSPTAPNAPVLQGNTTTPARGNANTNAQPQQPAKAAATQPQNNAGQPQRAPYRGRPENRPNVAPPRTQDNNNNSAQQQAGQQQQQTDQQQRDQQHRAAQQARQQQTQQQQVTPQQAQPRGQMHQQQTLQQQQQNDQQAQQQRDARRAQYEQQKQQREQQAAQQAQQQQTQQAQQQQAAQQQAEQQRRAQADQQRQQQAQQQKQQQDQQRQQQAEQQRQQQAQQQKQQQDQQRQQQAEQQRQQQKQQQEAQQKQQEQQKQQQEQQRQAQHQQQQQAAQQKQQQAQEQQQQQQHRRPPQKQE